MGGNSLNGLSCVSGLSFCGTVTNINWDEQDNVTDCLLALLLPTNFPNHFRWWKNMEVTKDTEQIKEIGGHLDSLPEFVT